MRRQLLVTAWLLIGLTVLAGTVTAQTIGWGNLQWPPTYSGASCSGDFVYGQVWIDGVTSLPGATPDLSAQLGFGPVGSTPDGSWLWVDATFNLDAGNNDEFYVALEYYIETGDYDYVYRYSYLGGDWYYADTAGPYSGSPGTATITDACGVVDVEPVPWSAAKAMYR